MGPILGIPGEVMDRGRLRITPFDFWIPPNPPKGRALLARRVSPGEVPGAVGVETTLGVWLLWAGFTWASLSRETPLTLYQSIRLTCGQDLTGG